MRYLVTVQTVAEEKAPHQPASLTAQVDAPNALAALDLAKASLAGTLKALGAEVPEQP